MLDVTTPQFRTLIRLSSPSAILFTEMIVDSTVNNISDEKLIEILGHPEDNTIVQLGGSEPSSLADAINRIKKIGYKEFNLNCGCPSVRVKKGCFGAVLMLKPELICDIINTVKKNCQVDLSLKIRIGVDQNDSYEFVYNFVEKVIRNTTCNTFFVHARKCLLNGLSPKDNRTIPPLKYEIVNRLKNDFKESNFVLNGGIKSLDMDFGQLDGAMIGREAMNNPFIFNDKDITDYKKDCFDLIERYFAHYAKAEMNSGLIHPLINLLNGRKYCKRYKEDLNNLLRKKVQIEVLIAKIKPYFETSDLNQPQ